MKSRNIMLWREQHSPYRKNGAESPDDMKVKQTNTHASPKSDKQPKKKTQAPLPSISHSSFIPRSSNLNFAFWCWGKIHKRKIKLVKSDSEVFYSIMPIGIDARKGTRRGNVYEFITQYMLSFFSLRLRALNFQIYDEKQKIGVRWPLDYCIFVIFLVSMSNFVSGKVPAFFSIHILHYFFIIRQAQWKYYKEGKLLFIPFSHECFSNLLLGECFHREKFDWIDIWNKASISMSNICGAQTHIALWRHMWTRIGAENESAPDLIHLS